jgi:hypothetical protein
MFYQINIADLIIDILLILLIIITQKKLINKFNNLKYITIFNIYKDIICYAYFSVLSLALIIL